MALGIQKAPAVHAHNESLIAIREHPQVSGCLWRKEAPPEKQERSAQDHVSVYAGRVEVSLVPLRGEGTVSLIGICSRKLQVGVPGK